jgi:cob(I)alamin adenosyltransferase
MKIYTKTGDDGTTGLFGGARVRKASTRVDAYGTIDELNASVGIATATNLEAKSAEVLRDVQNDLFVVGAELACVPGKEDKLSMRLLDEGDSARIEAAIDWFERKLPPLKSFVLPGGSPAAAALHVARTICRRAERGVLSLDDAPSRPEVNIYLNRLSDLFFVMARYENMAKGKDDLPWVPRQ